MTTATETTAAALPPVRSEPLLCLLDSVRELVAAYDEYERDQSATCARVYRGRLRLKEKLAEYDRHNAPRQTAERSGASLHADVGATIQQEEKR
jgi:hypothetical protein